MAIVKAQVLTVDRLRLRRGGGELTGTGRWRFDRPSARAELGWFGLDVDDIPLDRLGAKRVRQYVKGRSDGQLELRWVGHGLAGGGQLLDSREAKRGHQFDPAIVLLLTVHRVLGDRSFVNDDHGDFCIPHRPAVSVNYRYV